ncbi:hypothetical protein HanIR_Chr09g0393711 [Helianthus annuus]|nr:hypothetical protein HanIR_Chr09g0393711 [Helianthus annuus]
MHTSLNRSIQNLTFKEATQQFMLFSSIGRPRRSKLLFRPTQVCIRFHLANQI